MDRIQKALDKARENSGVAFPSKKSMPKKTAIASTDKSKHDPLKAPVDDISYTKTKVVNVSNHYLESKRIIAGMYNNPQSSGFRLLRTQVLQKMRANNWQTLAITSPTSGEGKSMVSANLAIAMAMELNQTVLLVDMDMRKPTQNDNFDLGVKYGLKDYLENDSVNLSDILVNPGIKGLVVLAGKGRAENSAELLSGHKMANLVDDLRTHYDSRMIIFDVPPILQTDDVILTSAYFDSTLLVLEDGKNDEASLVKTMQLLDGHNLIGTVLNKSELPPKHQNY